RGNRLVTDSKAAPGRLVNGRALYLDSSALLVLAGGAHADKSELMQGLGQAAEQGTALVSSVVAFEQVADYFVQRGSNRWQDFLHVISELVPQWFEFTREDLQRALELRVTFSLPRLLALEAGVV